MTAAGAIWVPSTGRKSGLCSGTHFRLYAPPVGYLSNRKLGHYVIATAHVDKNECFGCAQYGWNETAEATVASRAAAAWGAANVQANATLMPDGIDVHILAVRQRSERAAGEPLLRQQRTPDADPRPLAMIAARSAGHNAWGSRWHRTRRTLRHRSTSGSSELGDWRGETLSRVRGIIRSADPEIVEEWKWAKATSPGTPVWSHDGIICTGETYKSVVKLTFMKGASLEDPAGLFNSSLEGKTRRAIDIAEGDADRRGRAEGARPRGRRPERLRQEVAATV